MINAEHSAVYGKKYGILVTPELLFSSVITHEMVHSFFIGHSYSDRNVKVSFSFSFFLLAQISHLILFNLETLIIFKVFPHAAVGEYDDIYDLMSTANAMMHKSPFGFGGPGLNGPHLDYLGWLPMHRILFFGKYVRRE